MSAPLVSTQHVAAPPSRVYRAWTDPEDEPVCYASQVELAATLGRSERAVRAHERALSRDLGLIEKRTAANGSRSRAGALGLVFSRLIESGDPVLMRQALAWLYGFVRPQRRAIAVLLPSAICCWAAIWWWLPARIP